MRTTPLVSRTVPAEAGTHIGGTEAGTHEYFHTMDHTDIDALHEIGSRIAAADPLHDVLTRVVQFASSIVQCDSCFIYVLEDDTLMLRASKTPWRAKVFKFIRVICHPAFLAISVHAAVSRSRPTVVSSSRISAPCTFDVTLTRAVRPVRREQNARADELVNEALDEALA